MRNVYEVLRQKELELAKLEKEVEDKNSSLNKGAAKFIQECKDQG